MYIFGSITSGVLLAYVVSSEQLDAWGEMGAVAVLGALCGGFGVLHWKSQQLWAKTMERREETFLKMLRDQDEQD